MKKLILMLLVLVGGVMQASATTYKVYFTPGNSWTDASATFALYMYSSTSNKWVPFTETSTSGSYSAEYEDTYDSHIILVRLRPSTADGYSSENSGLNWTNKWNQTSDLACPTSDVYYYNVTGSGDSYSVSTRKLPFYVGAEHDIAPSYKGWTADATTQMEDNGDLTFTKTVTGNLIGADTYGFKIIDGDGNWLGDPNNYYNNYELQISQAGTYNITYTYNAITGVPTATSTKTGDTAPSYTYNVWCQDADGTDAITDGEWYLDANKMIMADGVASITYENKDLTVQTYSYKIVKRSFNGNNELYSQWIGEPGGGNKTIEISKASKYNVTFNYTVSSKTPSSSVTELLTGYYLVGGIGSAAWTVNTTPMTAADGNYSKSFTSDDHEYSFVVTDNTNINANNEVINWNIVYRPTEYKNIESFQNYGAETEKSGTTGNKWYIGYNGNVTFTFNPTANTWTAAPYFTRTIVNNNDDETEGYATFSSDYNVTIPEGVTAFYASANDDNKVTMTKITGTSIGKGDGVFLAAAPGTYNFTPAAATNVIKGNLLKKPTGDDSNTVPVGGYVFAKQSGNLGFYKVTAELTNQKGKAYLDLGSNAPMLSFDFGEGTTGINVVRSQMEEAREGIFDLQGRRVENPTKGLYIVNGKKVFIK